VAADPDNGDYIYLNQKLVDLPGNKLHKKRNQINQFLAAAPRPCRPAAAALRPGRLASSYLKSGAACAPASNWISPTKLGLDLGAEPFCRAGAAGSGDLFGRPAARFFGLLRG